MISDSFMPRHMDACSRVCFRTSGSVASMVGRVAWIISDTAGKNFDVATRRLTAPRTRAGSYPRRASAYISAVLWRSSAFCRNLGNDSNSRSMASNIPWSGRFVGFGVVVVGARDVGFAPIVFAPLHGFFDPVEPSHDKSAGFLAAGID